MLKNTKYMFVVHIEKFRKSYEKLVWKNFKNILEFLREWNKIVEKEEGIPGNVKEFMLSQITVLQEMRNWAF